MLRKILIFWGKQGIKYFLVVSITCEVKKTKIQQLHGTHTDGQINHDIIQVLSRKWEKIVSSHRADTKLKSKVLQTTFFPTANFLK